ncbi:hypothetical protein O181_121458 [Austropuccinia psidii MF-1]|uniref:Uncharacterized protein n=1 Tax=Austropuccinia psidii MF-1 TaxID=1389203 RepID=A0A9Q3KHL2_9BASI|nr:hypothetical protein [Austropuccinia psidii MF-1]
MEYIMKNQSSNGNDYGQATLKKASRKPNIKNNGDKDKSLLPQEVTSPPILFSKLLKPEASLKKDNDEIQKLQLFPSNMSKIEIRKSEQELAKELTQEPKEESDTYLPKENKLFHIHTSNNDTTSPEYSQHIKNFNQSRELNKEIPPENQAIKQVVTVEKEGEITKNEDSIESRPKDPTNISIQAKEHKHESTDIYGHSPHHKEYLERENKNEKRNLVKCIIQISFKKKRRAKPYDRIAPNQKLSSNSPLHLAYRYQA